MVRLSSWGDSAVLLGSLGCPMPVGPPKTLPDWPSLIAWFTCLGRTAYFTRGKVSNCWGRIASFAWGKVSNCLRRTASFPRGKESTCLTASWGWIASFPRRKVSNCWGRIASFAWGKVSNCLGRTASFPRGKESTCLTTCWGRIASFPGCKENNCLIYIQTLANLQLAAHCIRYKMVNLNWLHMPVRDFLRQQKVIPSQSWNCVD